MILDHAMVSAKLERWREIEQTLRACKDCKKLMLVHDFMDVDPCPEHKPLALELKHLAEAGPQKRT